MQENPSESEAVDTAEDLQANSAASEDKAAAQNQSAQRGPMFKPGTWPVAAGALSILLFGAFGICLGIIAIASGLNLRKKDSANKRGIAAIVLGAVGMVVSVVYFAVYSAGILQLPVG